MMKRLLIILILLILTGFVIYAGDNKSDYELFKNKKISIIYTLKDGGTTPEVIFGTLEKIGDNGLLITSMTKKEKITYFIRFEYIVFIELIESSKK